MRVWKRENCCSNEHKTVKDLDAISLAHLGSIFSLRWQQRNHWIESRSCWEQISGYKCNFHSTKETLLFQIQSPLTQLYLNCEDRITEEFSMYFHLLDKINAGRRKYQRIFCLQCCQQICFLFNISHITGPSFSSQWILTLLSQIFFIYSSLKYFPEEDWHMVCPVQRTGRDWRTVLHCLRTHHCQHHTHPASHSLICSHHPGLDSALPNKLQHQKCRVCISNIKYPLKLLCGVRPLKSINVAVLCCLQS